MLKQNLLFKVSDKESDARYTTKSAVPQYTPSSTKPQLATLYNATHYSNLINDINNANIDESEKHFLRLAASRHIVFNYSQIADYYAHASVEMQLLMEQSGLVIIDVEDAIAYGYVKLSKDIKRIMQESGKKTDEK